MKKKKLSERSAGYLLIFPSMLLILVVAIWPVLQSFYLSLFDLKLNDPTKSTVHLNYSFDLERYLNSAPFLISSIDQEIQSGHHVDELTKVKTQINQFDAVLQKDPDIKKSYQTVNDKLMDFKSISDDEALIPIDKKLSEQYQNMTHQVQQELKDVTKKAKLEQEDKISGLANGLNDALIKSNFVGLQHYKENLSSPRTWLAIWNTLFFTVVSVAFELVIGLAIALLINKAFFGRGLIRASILIPWAIPTAVSALMWKFLYDGQNGIVAYLFEKVGLVDKMSDLLTTNTGAMFSVIFTDVWKTTPYMALLLLAGLLTIPSSLYEAAAIDGANKWQQFIKITLPLLKSSLLVALLFRTLDAFRVFDLIFVLTGGGPANSTETISILAYKVMFSQTNFGNGSSLSVIVFVCVAIISIIYIKLLGADLIQDSNKK
ncbi:ABC transporter permease subunit [Terrilactibacillus sp. BCM23-1]|uniref:ABC transporter permease subunit n=2 Tax=Terrilactibacillus tamarindi TaxID=2599694 RepID=A0A6N8CNV9_9BACI|nr:sugar ABC transporter permease [Terrilactibacillus tamarindi]MTT31318.1 ABC transporter permease subunit [Terrilactibacillus tamarindi]